MSALVVLLLLALMISLATILVALGSDFYSDLDRLSKEGSEVYDWEQDDQSLASWINTGSSDNDLPSWSDDSDSDYLDNWAPGTERDTDSTYQQRVAEYEQWVEEEVNRDRARGLVFSAALVTAIAAAVGFTLLRRR